MNKPQPFIWKLETMCSDCPFARSGPGRYLRSTLRPGRWREILRSLKHSCFPCHKTMADTSENGNDSRLICAGAYAHQARYNYWPQYRQVMERLSMTYQQQGGKGKDGTEKHDDHE